MLGPLPVDEAVVFDFCREYGFNDLVKDFVVIPTVLGVSPLTRAIADYDDLTSGVSGFEASLKAGFNYLAGELRAGRGRTGIEALRRLRSGGVLITSRRIPGFHLRCTPPN